MVTKKEWMLRLLSFGLGFVTGRLTAKTPTTAEGRLVAKKEWDNPPTEEELFTAIVSGH